MTAEKRTQQVAKLSRQYKSRKQRPCDFCRKRKVRCIINGLLPCVRCEKLNGGNCTFNDGPIKKLRRPKAPDARGAPQLAPLSAPLSAPPTALAAPPLAAAPPAPVPASAASAALAAPYMYQKHDYEFSPSASPANLYQSTQGFDCPPRPYMHIPPQMGSFLVGDRQPPDGCKPYAWPSQEFVGSAQWFPLLPAEIRTSHSVPTASVAPTNDGNWVEQRAQNPQACPVGDVDGMGEDFHEYILKMM